MELGAVLHPPTAATGTTFTLPSRFTEPPSGSTHTGWIQADLFNVQTTLAHTFSGWI